MRVGVRGERMRGERGYSRSDVVPGAQSGYRHGVKYCVEYTATKFV